MAVSPVDEVSWSAVTAILALVGTLVSGVVNWVRTDMRVEGLEKQKADNAAQIKDLWEHQNAMRESSDKYRAELPDRFVSKADFREVLADIKASISQGFAAVTQAIQTGDRAIEARLDRVERRQDEKR